MNKINLIFELIINVDWG